MIDSSTEKIDSRADRLHIVFLCNEYPPSSHGGIGSFTQTMARALTARGHKVTVMGLYRQSKDSREDDCGISVVRLAHARKPGLGLVVNGRRLTKALKRLHAEHPINILEGPENSLALVQGNFPAVKIIRMHGGHHFFYTTLGLKPRFWRSLIEKRSVQKADHFCGVSQFVAEQTRTLLGLAGRPIEILPNGVNVAQFHPRAEIAEEPGLVIFVGTLCEKKGVRQLVQAMPQIVKAVPTAHLWLVGRDSLDPDSEVSFSQQLTALIPEWLKDRIKFCGPVIHPSLPELLARAEVLVYPSHMESIGIAPIEGLAMGKALVIGNTGPAPEVVEDGVSGLLCDPFSPSSIAAAVIQLMRDQALRRKMGERARSRAVELFCMEKVADRNEAFYRRCLS